MPPIVKLNLLIYRTSHKLNGACRTNPHAPFYLYIALLFLAE